MSRFSETTVAAAIVLGAATVVQGLTIVNIDAGRGPIKLYVPDGYDPQHPAPLLLSLHGAGQNGQIFEDWFGIRNMVDDKGFLYAHPDGGCPAGSYLRWCYPATGIDDPAYLRQLIAAIAARYSVNPNRVFLYGCSSGGITAYAMACRYADVITGIAVFTGRVHPDMPECRPTDPVHILHIYGTVDSLPIMLWPCRADLPYNADFWAHSNGCSLTYEGARCGCADTPADPCDDSLGRLDLVAALPGEETVVTRWAQGCATTGVVELWAVRGAGHPVVDPKWAMSDYPPLGQLAVNWLLAHPADCNRNGKPDDEDVADGTSRDCNRNDVPDECEPRDDCNGNSIQDICDIASGASHDRDGSGIPDECEPPTITYVSIERLGQMESVKLYMPSWYDPQHPLPLLLALHGSPSSGDSLESAARHADLVNEMGFFYAHPNGSIPFSGAYRWDRGSGPDADFLLRLIKAVQAQFSVDPSRIFLLGVSDGGYMAYATACRHADTIAGINIFTGDVPGGISSCHPTNPLHILHIHGTLDTAIPYPSTSMLEFWARSNGCALTYEGARPGCKDTPADPCDASLGRLDLVAAVPGAETVITRYAQGCSATGVVELWTVLGAGHPGIDPKWAMSDYPPATRLVDEWLLAHPRDCNGNGALDVEDIASGGSHDCNQNFVPDECEPGATDLTQADFNGDCHVDITDLAAFEACAGGPALPRAPGCALVPDLQGIIRADFDRDADVDQDDFGVFQRCYSGAGKPADPGCANSP